jgi:hypothetical protein
MCHTAAPQERRDIKPGTTVILLFHHGDNGDSRMMTYRIDEEVHEPDLQILSVRSEWVSILNEAPFLGRTVQLPEADGSFRFVTIKDIYRDE